MYSKNIVYLVNRFIVRVRGHVFKKAFHRNIKTNHHSIFNSDASGPQYKCRNTSGGGSCNNYNYRKHAEPEIFF